MYVLFGNQIIDSKEMKEIIEKNSEFKVIKDMSKGSKRDDVLAFNLSISIDKLNSIISENMNILNNSKDKISEDDLFLEYLNLAEELASDIEEFIPKDAILDIKSYKWDKSDNDIKLVIAISHEELGKTKLSKVMKTLLKQIE
ncbi:hypothetical protein SAMN05428976_10353 [Clostridium sp. USBA 49]|jgi:hypothetical protein|uniref:hypothetical protein n=1 Tax=Clostridium TaxID=1485 RepID=UPI00099A95A6|nr:MULTISPECIES: hypothetical protein [Clostridium]SKA78258.1 hypothetical protein SAMN05428976_10353 [Clostridium sp. USBA 49]